jgi:hypothetical protein
MEILNPNEQKLQDDQTLAEENVVLLLDQGLNRDDDPDPHHLGSWIPVHLGSEACELNGQYHFLPTFTTVRVRYLSSAEIKAQSTPGGLKKEGYEVLETRRIRAFQLLSEMHPAAMTGDERAIKHWRSNFAEMIQRDKAIFESSRTKLAHDANERNRTTENRLAEGIAEFMAKFATAATKTTSSKLP